MNRRSALKTVGKSLAVPALLTSTATGNSDKRKTGGQPLGGELPNENVPQASITTLPPRFGTTDTTREVGTFLTLAEGWAGVTDKTELLLDSIREEFTYDGQTFVLDSADDWEANDDGSYWFRHTEPPFPKGKTVEVSADVTVTDAFYDPLQEKEYEAGERYAPSVYPTSRTYEIVGKEDEEGEEKGEKKNGKGEKNGRKGGRN